MSQQFSTRMQNELLTTGKSVLDFNSHASAGETNTKRIRHYSNGREVSETHHYDLVLKVILLGDPGVGKTSFLKALRIHPDVTKAQCKCRYAQVADHLEVEVTTNQGKNTLVRLCDTGGQERYRSLTSSYYRGASGVLLIFDLKSAKSLDNVESWLSDLESFSSASTCARVLLGSNCASQAREVSSQVAKKYAENRKLPYMEFDTTQYYNIIEALQLTVDKIAKEVSVSPVSSSVIKPNWRSETTDQHTDKKFPCLC